MFSTSPPLYPSFFPAYVAAAAAAPPRVHKWELNLYVTAYSGLGEYSVITSGSASTLHFRPTADPFFLT